VSDGGLSANVSGAQTGQGGTSSLAKSNHEDYKHIHEDYKSNNDEYNKSSHNNDYENQNQKMNMGGGSVGTSYDDFAAHHTSLLGSIGGGGGTNGESSCSALGISLPRGHSGGGGKSRHNGGIPDDSKLLANPKGIIKSFLPQVPYCIL